MATVGNFAEVTAGSNDAWTPQWMGEKRTALHHDTVAKPSSFIRSDVDIIGEDTAESDVGIVSARPLSPNRGVDARGKRDVVQLADDEEIMVLPDGRKAVVKKKVPHYRDKVPKQWVTLTDEPTTTEQTFSPERTSSKFRVNPAHVDIATPPSVSRADLDAAANNVELREEIDTTHHIKRDQWTDYWETTERYRRMLGKDIR